MDSQFSAKVKEIISFSREEALRLGNDFIGTEHLLLGMIRDGQGLGIKILQNLKVDMIDLRRELEKVIKNKGINKNVQKFVPGLMQPIGIQQGGNNIRMKVF